MTRKLVFVILIAICITQIRAADYCFAEDKDRYQYFGSYTSYHNVRGTNMEIPTGCTPIYLWVLVKDGVRYMPKDLDENIAKIVPNVRDEILKNAAEKRGKLCEKDVDLIKNWKYESHVDKANELTPSGLVTPGVIMERLQTKFSQLLSSKSKTSYDFKSADSPSASTTLLQILNKLLGTQFTDPKTSGIATEDFLLQLNNHCPKWTEALKNPEITKERDLFIKSSNFETASKNFNKRLGFENSELSKETIDLLHQLCGFETARMSNEGEALCACFEPDFLKVMEYMNDINFYNRFGPGNPDIDKMGCPMVQTLLTNISNIAENKDSQIKSSIFTTNSDETFMSLLIKLGLFSSNEQQPIKSDNFNLMQNRKFKTSEIIPFSANFIAVLYSCSNNEEKQVNFFLNEKPVNLPGCNNNLCSLKFLKEKYSDVFKPNQCGSEFCTKVEASKPSSGAMRLFSTNLFTGFIVCCSYVLYKQFFL